MDDLQRERIRTALEKHFEWSGYPRFLLSIIVIVTGAVGFFVSHALLVHWQVKMWVRYPVAVGAAYIAFLVLLRIWVELERWRLDPEKVRLIAMEKSNVVTSGTIPNGKKGSPWDWLDLPTDLVPAEEGCAVALVLILLVLGVGGAIIFVIYTAPALLAEVFLDAVDLTLLFKRLKTAARHHWLGTAIRRTWIAVLITAITLSLAGAVIQSKHPKAKSIGDLWRQPG